MSRYSIHKLDVNSGTIAQITSINTSPNLEIRRSQAGRIAPTFATIASARPTIALTTTALNAALTAMGATGAALSAAATIYFRKRVQDGKISATNDNLSLALASGMIAPSRLTARQGQPASLEFMVFGRSSDGVTNPWSISTSVTLSGTNAVDGEWTLGPVAINGSEVGDVQSVDVDFGLEIRQVYGDGHSYPTQIALYSQMPSITFETGNALNLNAIGLAGSQIGASDALIYLRKKTQDGDVVADGTSGHISIGIDEGMVTPDSASSDGIEDWMSSFTIHPTDDGTNPTIALSLATTIS